MQYFQKLIKFFFIILIFSFNSVSSSEKVSFVDIDYVIKNSNLGKKTLQIIEDLDKKNVENFKNKNKELKDIENAIKNKKNIISKDDFNKEVLDFQNKLKEFTIEKNETAKDFNDFRNKELQKLFKLIRPLISNYMEQNSINILMDAKYVFMANDNINLTEEVLKIINNEIK